ncbi:hydrolase [Brevundimonas sp. A19_0]|uniref:hydrolase n=1 Tax=Brevundimonas sp. A19_0 TaxID=2821087 RepID=UPI001ADAE46F|nr:hydrolase [Brevundimonas sp. A19_0]MBO9501780.1 hydrolase [Brevundimonas sp. A19_0]
MQIRPEDQIVLDHVAARREALIGRAIDWANINSGSRNTRGLERVLVAIEESLGALPCRTERVETSVSSRIEDDGREVPLTFAPALKLVQRPDAPVQVVLTGHYDTVFDADSPFQTVGTRADGALNGPGIADMKGGISVLLGALEAFERHPDRDKVGWTVLLSPDEEIGSPGSAPLLAELGARGHLGLTYEPSLPDGSLAGARKGSGNFHIVVRGKSAHAGRAYHEGVNATAGAARLATALDDLNGQREGVTINVAKISGGGALNVVADTAVVRFNVRVPTPEDAEWIEGRIRDLSSRPPIQGATVELHGGFTRPPKPMDAAQTALFEAVRQTGALLNQTLRWQSSGGVCEGNNLHAAGLPNIDTLGVIGGAIHSDQEFAWPDSFVERAQLSALILCKVASGEIDAPHLKQLRLQSR